MSASLDDTEITDTRSSAPLSESSAPLSAPMVASITEPLSADGGEVRDLPPGVRWLEVRADLIGDIEVESLRRHFDGELIYTLRSRKEGGEFNGGHGARLRRLSAAAEVYDLVDLESERDLEGDLLSAVPAGKRLLSWHGKSTHLTGLKKRFADMSRTPARFYKMIPRAVQSGDGIRCLALLQSLRRRDVVCFASGDIGTWTRVLAPRLGCPMVFGSLTATPAAPGQPTVRKLHDDYGLPELRELKGLFGIVGKPVHHSLSPKLHNGAYRNLDVPGVYVAFHVESFGDFWLDVVESGSLAALGMPLWGLSVTSPYKQLALAVSGASSPRAQHIEAANTLVLSGEVWEAESTDPEGIVLALNRFGVEIKGQRAAVVGCGGAGKAAAYGLQLAGAEVTLVNRTPERGKIAAIELGLPFCPLDDFAVEDFDLIVQATALGHDPSDALPFDPERLADDAAVVDMVYGDQPTRLIERVRELGRVGIGGRTVLLFQALEQFRLMTGRELSEELARDILQLGGPV